MPRYHARFSILGEVTEMLFTDTPSPRLMIDISARPAPDSETPGFSYRTSFTALEKSLIDSLQDEVVPGDVIEATGSFWQTGYLPHPKGRIDTTFCLTGFRMVEKRDEGAERYNPFEGLTPEPVIH